MNVREKTRELVEARRAQLEAESNALREDYRDYAEGIIEGYQKRYGRDVPDNVLATTLQSLQNFTTEEILKETTTTANVGTFADYGYQLISATLPNLVTNEIASLQPLKIKTGTIWYLNYQYPEARGQSAAGGNVLDAKTGIPDYIHMTDQTIYQENVGTGNGTIASFTVTLQKTYVTAGSVTVVAGPVTAVDNGAGAFTGSGVDTGTSTIDYTTGVMTIAFSSAVGNGTTVDATYNFSYEAPSDGTTNINEVDIDIAQDSVTATEYKLRARYSLDAAFDLQQVQGVNADDLLVASMASLIRADIDRTVMEDQYTQALANTNMGTVTFDATIPTYIPLKAHYDAFKKVMNVGSNKIFGRTKMVGATFAVAGLDVCNVIEYVDGYEGIKPTGGFSGPHVCGELNGIKIIKNPHITSNVFYLGHKGGDYLNCGYVFAPYRALYLSPSIVLDDDRGRRVMAMSAGTKMVNIDMFVAGSITNFS
jgi:hypothetical protein